MKLVVTPNKEVIDRALQQGFDSRHIKDKCYYGKDRTIALMESRLFEPVQYLGTATILRHKLKSYMRYTLTYSGPSFAGDLIKLALMVLKQRRVRIFIHQKDSDKQFKVLMLGTKEGTVAIAPRVWEGDDHPASILDDITFLLSDYWRYPTSKLVRGVLFGIL